MTLQKLIRVLQICDENMGAESTWVSAEHDIIYLPLMSDADLPALHLRELEEAGAFKSDADCWAVYT